jgi:hypothetical protein
MTDRWLRWYDGTVRDGKMRIVAELTGEAVATVIGVWASLLEDAATSHTRGVATRGSKWHALYLQLSEELIGTAWNAFEQVEMVAARGDEIHINNWGKRQFETDTKDPTAKARKNKWKQSHTPDGTERNGTERFGTPETETETENSIDSPNGESSASPDGEAPRQADSIPCKAIVDGYNRELTNLAKVRELTPKRRSLIRSAWQASPDRRSLDFWNAYWAECQADDFLNGTGPYRETHANWRPNFDYLLRADVVTRTFERAMDRMERAA